MKAVEAVKVKFYCFWVLYTQLYTIQLGNLTTYKRNFWDIVKPWERFQRWVRLIYFLTVPDDHTVPQS